MTDTTPSPTELSASAAEHILDAAIDDPHVEPSIEGDVTREDAREQLTYLNALVELHEAYPLDNPARQFSRLKRLVSRHLESVGGTTGIVYKLLSNNNLDLALEPSLEAFLLGIPRPQIGSNYCTDGEPA